MGSTLNLPFPWRSVTVPNTKCHWTTSVPGKWHLSPSNGLSREGARKWQTTCAATAIPLNKHGEIKSVGRCAWRDMVLSLAESRFTVRAPVGHVTAWQWNLSMLLRVCVRFRCSSSTAMFAGRRCHVTLLLSFALTGVSVNPTVAGQVPPDYVSTLDRRMSKWCWLFQVCRIYFNFQNNATKRQRFPYKNVTQRQLLTHGHITKLHVHNVQAVFNGFNIHPWFCSAVKRYVVKVGFSSRTHYKTFLCKCVIFLNILSCFLC